MTGGRPAAAAGGAPDYDVEGTAVDVGTTRGSP